MNFLTTTIVEIGPGQVSHQYTGRTVVFPNSIFVTFPIINETFTGMYVLHTFCVPLRIKDDWRSVEHKLLEAAHAECKEFLEDAQERMSSLSKRESLDVPSVEPRVTIQLPEPGRIDLLVRIPTPARRKGKIEQAILRRVFATV
jgi:small-conductance mechanosensitive channel